MTTTRAARLTQHGKPLQLQQVQLAEPSDDEVLVAVDYAGVNPIDRYNATGQVATGMPLPRTLGVEGAGTLSDGTRVLVNGEGLGFARDGTWAEHAVVPRSAVVPIPDGLSGSIAASIAVAGLTAWAVVALRAKVTEADTVLVMGAGGGVGLAVVSLAASRGARVIGQVGTAGKAEAVRAAGAERVIIGAAAAIAGEAANIPGSETSCTVVVDPLGGAFTPAAMGLLVNGGRYVVFGTSAGGQVTLDWQLVYRRGITVHGQANTLFTAAERHQHLRDAMTSAVAGDLSIPVDRLVPLEQVNDALAALVERSVTGKLVLDLTSGR